MCRGDQYSTGFTKFMGLCCVYPILLFTLMCQCTPQVLLYCLIVYQAYQSHDGAECDCDYDGKSFRLIFAITAVLLSKLIKDYVSVRRGHDRAFLAHVLRLYVVDFVSLNTPRK